MSAFLSVFRSEGKLSRLLLVMYIAINSLVLVNVALHSPYVGYDIPEHLKSITALSQFHLANRLESREFFSPPLPYILPAAAMILGASLWWAGKVGQIVNIFLSLGLTYTLLRICEQIFPGRTRFKLLALGLLGLMPVYYKTFAQERGEPYVTFLAVLAVYLTLRIFVYRNAGRRALIGLGVVMGLAILARQWGFFMFPAIGLIVLVGMLTRRQTWKKDLLSFAAVVAIAFVLGSWFYFYLYSQYGTFTAFNRRPDGASSLSKHIKMFTGNGNGKLFIDPVRPSLGTDFFPVFYSDFWGDYHAYFLIYTQDRNTGEFWTGAQLQKWIGKTAGDLPNWIQTNRYSFNLYLRKVNMVSILPSLLLLAGFFYGLWLLYKMLRSPGDPQASALGLVALATFATTAGYLWFVFSYPDSGDGDTIKATYLMQAYPFIALQTAALLQKIRSPRLLALLGILLALVVAYNLPAMITHFIDIPK